MHRIFLGLFLLFNLAASSAEYKCTTKDNYKIIANYDHKEINISIIYDNLGRYPEYSSTWKKSIKFISWGVYECRGPKSFPSANYIVDMNKCTVKPIK